MVAARRVVAIVVLHACVSCGDDDPCDFASDCPDGAVCLDIDVQSACVVLEEACPGDTCPPEVCGQLEILCEINEVCMYNYGDPRCECPEYYAGDETSCSDIDECANDNGGCGAPSDWVCSNNEGAAPTCTAVGVCAENNGGCGDPAYWTCASNEGAEPTCTDIDECASDNGGCGDVAAVTCTNNVAAAPSCTDIDECASDNGGCGDAAYVTCTNNDAVAPTCSDIDECATDNGGCGNSSYWLCTNNHAAAPTCTDINECTTDNGGCGDAAYVTCTNKNAAVHTCTDINECATDNGGCGDVAYVMCTNNHAAAPICTDINECATDNGGCGDSSYRLCSNYHAAAPTCTDINECAINNGGCGDAAHVACTNNNAAAPTCTHINECATANGACGDPAYVTCSDNNAAAPTCTDINECAIANGGCGDGAYVTCTNNDAGAPTCTDVNECATSNGGCGDATYWTCTNNHAAAQTCSDTNECAASNGGCGTSTYWACTNNTGASPTCHFKYNYAFLSPEPVTGDMAGIASADAQCWWWAAEAGIEGNFTALLSTATVHARDRLAGARGWIRTDGRPVGDLATDIADVYSKGLLAPLQVDANGSDLGSKYVWSASYNDAEYFAVGGADDCAAWSSVNGTARYGFSTSTSEWLDRGGSQSCSESAHIYCFQIDKNTSLQLADFNQTGRRMFVSTGNLTVTAGIAGADALCAADAQQLGGTFKAFIADVNVSAMSRFTSTATPIVRTDGLLVADDFSVLVAGNLVHPPQLRINRTPHTWRVFTGAASPSSAGSAATTCDGWSSTAGNAQEGFPSVTVNAGAERHWFGYDTASCASHNDAIPVYCLEE